MKLNSSRTKYAAEFVGTFFIVFTIGCNLSTRSVGTVLSVGFIITAMVCSLGSLSGAHFNPAITLAVLMSGRFRMSIREVVCYLLSQVLGGILGSLAHWSVASSTAQQRPSFSYSTEAVAVEVIYTWALCYVFLNVAVQDSRLQEEQGVTGTVNGLAVGFTVTGAMVAAGPTPGCSLNPAATLGSLCVARLVGERAALSCPFTMAPLLGALLGALSLYLVRGCGDGDAVPSREDWLLPAIDVSLGPPREAGEQSPGRLRTEDKGPPSGSIRLLKQVPTNLPDITREQQLYFGLRWRLKQSKQGESEIFGVDLSCAKFGRGGECLGGVYFGEKHDPESGMLHRSYEEMKHLGVVDNELIMFRLSDIKPSVCALVFSFMIYSGEQSFSCMEQCYVRLVNISDKQKEFCRYDENLETSSEHENAVIAAILYRAHNRWAFRAVDERFALPANSSYRKLIPQMSDMVLQTCGPRIDTP
mmetsp:Transcript_54090/g.125804  ORF Transcript_54090/g.125804 Transcript_54090/m.125804 type:complete len:473 (-) Transcript_54090:67-1485(-)